MNFFQKARRAVGIEPSAIAKRTSIELEALRDNIRGRQAVLDGLQAELSSMRAQLAKIDKGSSSKDEAVKLAAELEEAEKAFAPIEAAYLAEPTLASAKAHDVARDALLAARASASRARDHHARVQAGAVRAESALNARVSVLEQQIANAQSAIASAEKDLALVPLRIASSPAAAHADVLEHARSIMSSVEAIVSALDAIDQRWLLAKKACDDHVELGGSVIRTLDHEALMLPLLELLLERGYVSSKSFRYLLEVNSDWKRSPLGDHQSKHGLVAELVRMVTGPKASSSAIEAERGRLRRMKMTATGAPHEIDLAEHHELAAQGDHDSLRILGRHQILNAIDHVPAHKRADEAKRLGAAWDKRSSSGVDSYDDSFEMVPLEELEAERRAAMTDQASNFEPVAKSAKAPRKS